MKATASIIVWMLTMTMTYGQKAISFTATCDADEVVIGNYVQVLFTLKNTKGQNFDPPSLKGFKILSGPNRSSQTSIINGRISSELTYLYGLQPLKEGTLTIGSATIEGGGKTWKTRPLTIRVVKGNSTLTPGKDDSPDFFLKAIVHENDHLVGQQIIVDYTIFTAVNIEKYHIVANPDFNEFFAKPIRTANITKQVVVNGRQYRSMILRRYALFPQQAGTYTLDPMILKVGVAKNPFALPKYHNLQSELLTITIKEFPRDAPSDFSGAVGHYKMVSNSSKEGKISTDDDITIRLQITGDGDIKRLTPPVIETPEIVESYDANTLKEDSYEHNNRLWGEKIFEYSFVPVEPGACEITPTFTYFDVDSSDFVTLRGKTYRYQVRQGRRKITRTEINPPGPATGERDIRYIKTAFTLEKSKDPFWGSTMFWALLSLPLFAVIGLIFYKRMALKQQGIDPLLLKRRRALKLAEKRLEIAKQHMAGNLGRDFYDEVSKALFGYASDKIDIPLSELSKQNIANKLTGGGITTERVNQFIELLKRCELALFAGMDGSDEMRTTYEAAVEVIAGIEEG